MVFYIVLTTLYLLSCFLFYGGLDLKHTLDKHEYKMNVPVCALKSLTWPVYVVILLVIKATKKLYK